MERYVTYILKGRCYPVFNVDNNKYYDIGRVEKEVNLSGFDDGLYILSSNPKWKVKLVRTQDNRIVEHTDYCRIVDILKAGIINYTSKYKWCCFSIKPPAKKFYDLGDSSLAYEIIEFNCTEAEAKKYQHNLLSYVDGVARAYRYKFTFYYMMNSNKTVSEYDIRNYTTDMSVYRKYNAQCEITLNSVEGRIKDGSFV